MFKSLTSLVADLDDLTPRQIVGELDKYIVGQHAAKRSVAIALRNRWRRRQLDPELAEEVMPKNILMIGPTGVGKTEIARRLARLARAPFSKVEASKFTEVGYVGRDVESMIRDLVEISVGMVRQERRQAVRDVAERHGGGPLAGHSRPRAQPASRREKASVKDLTSPRPARSSARSWSRRRPRRARGRGRGAGLLGPWAADVHTPGRGGSRHQPEGDAAGMFSKRQLQKMSVGDAREILIEQEADKSSSTSTRSPARLAGGWSRTASSSSTRSTRSRAGNRVTAPTSRAKGSSATCCRSSRAAPSPPSTVRCKTDHILFLAAGAFHVSKPSDLIPELQGRFPIRVELSALTEEDLPCASSPSPTTR